MRAAAPVEAVLAGSPRAIDPAAVRVVDVGLLSGDWSRTTLPLAAMVVLALTGWLGFLLRRRAALGVREVDPEPLSIFRT